MSKPEPVFIRVELQDGVSPTFAQQQIAAALVGSGLAKDVKFEDGAEWTDQEIADHALIEGDEWSFESTSRNYVKISPHMRIPLTRQERAMLEFFLVTGRCVTGQRVLHKFLSAFESPTMGCVVFEASEPRVLTAIYSRLRKKLERELDRPVLMAKRGNYGFKAAERPTYGAEAVARPKDTTGLLDPRVPLDKAMRRMVDE